MSWYGLRDYGCYEIEYTVETRNPQQRESREMRIVAPTEGMAAAYLGSMNRSNNPVVTAIRKLKIDGVVLAMNG